MEKEKEETPRTCAETTATNERDTSCSCSCSCKSTHRKKRKVKENRGAKKFSNLWRFTGGGLGLGGCTDGRQNFCSENIKMERTSVTKTTKVKKSGLKKGEVEGGKRAWMGSRRLPVAARRRRSSGGRRTFYVCVCVWVGERERVEMDHRLSLFFSFSLPPFLAWVIFYFSAVAATWVRSKLSARLFAQANNSGRHTGRHCNAVAVPA